MSALLKVVSLLFLLFIANIFIFTSPVLAATQNFKQLDSTNFNDSINTDRFYRNQMVTLYHTFFGTDPFGNPVYSEKIVLTTENGQSKIASIPGLSSGDSSNGAIGMLGNTIATLYTPPTSSAEYLANLGENIGFSPKMANAQSPTGSGADVISPVLELWKVVRNIAYAGFILVFIAAGLMIMFRQKLNPQTTIGIQQALPGLIIGLILVTFSYFIAAFIVDLTFVGTRLVAEIFISSGTTNLYGAEEKKDLGDIRAKIDETYNESSAFNMFNKAGSKGFLQNVTDIFGAVWSTIGPKPDPSYKTDPLITSAIPFIGPIYSIVGSLFHANPLEVAAAGGVSMLAALLVPIILAIALMIQFIRLIIALLMSYIQILIMVIGGPIFILISAIPGRGGVLSYWFKGLLANALVFPAVFAGFLFAGLLLKYDFNVSQARLPLFGGLQPNIIQSLLAFGVLLGLPSIPEMVRSAFGVKGPQGFTQAALGGFMGGMNTGRSGATAGYNQAMERSGTRAQQQAYQKAKLEAEEEEGIEKEGEIMELATPDDEVEEVGGGDEGEERE